MYQSFCVITLTVLSCLLQGCAYNFSGVRRGLPEGYNQVFVPVFKNLTMETGIEGYFTGALVEEIERSHQTTVTAKSEAQVLLEGAINYVRVEQGPVLDNGSDPLKRLPQNIALAKEYRIVITVSMTLRRKSDDKVLWAGNFSGEQRYSAPLIGEPIINSANAPYNQSIREQTIQLMARDMMSEVHDRLTENF